MNRVPSLPRSGREGDRLGARRTPCTIALWGERGSGKSGVIGALRSEAAKTVGERWSLDADGAAPAAVEYADSASLALRLRDVKQTAVERPDVPVTLTAKRFVGSRQQETMHVAVLDPRGKIADSAFASDARDVLHALATADGIIWLVESRNAVDEAWRSRLLAQIVATLDSAGKEQLDIPVAIVLSKIDRLSTVEMRRALNAPEEALRAQLGNAAFGWLLAACPRLRCFALSAAGTVRNAARPVGLSAPLDWFGAEWRREERDIESARARERRSARVAVVRRRVPTAALAVAAAAVVVFAGGAAARRLGHRPPIWNSSAGNVATTSSPPAPSHVRQPDSIGRVGEAAAASSPAAPSLAGAVASFAAGDTRAALVQLGAFDLAATDTTWFAADSVLAEVALAGAETALRASPPDSVLLRLVVSTTSAAIARSHPGTYVLAPLSLARAEACIGGRLDCPAERLREDLVWALLFGTPAQQDGARRLRAAWLADSTGAGS